MAFHYHQCPNCVTTYDCNISHRYLSRAGSMKVRTTTRKRRVQLCPYAHNPKSIVMGSGHLRVRKGER
ncbi:hypothetical protein LCGC14_1973740 [marine sediment metagenome]|uniref:Uncharacterized protein n=1 Tax=marine sediment metagenome TaxID=412755 RepID=A0A0F9HPC0_9ZZZZ